jgi:hypothetical protein
MRLAKGIAAVACFLVGLWLTLRAAGLLTGVLHAVPRWWPALPAAIGAAILVRSRRPGPHTAVSLVLIAASGAAYVIIHHLITATTWPFAVGAGLMAVGLALTYLTVRPSSRPRDVRKQRIVMAFRSAMLPAASADLARIRVYMFCGHLELDIRECLPPGSFPDEPLMIEIVTCLGNVTLVAYPGLTIHHHKAFVMRFGYPADSAILYDEDTTDAAAVVATLSFFGNVTVRQRNPTAVFPGN